MQLNIPILDPQGRELVFSEVPTPINIFQQGQFSTELSALSSVTISQIAYPAEDKRPPVKELSDMGERDPVASNCIAVKALRATQYFGNYTHPKKEIEDFVNSNLNTLRKSFKRTLFKILASVILYGFCVAEYTFTSNARGYKGQWRLGNINILNPERIKNFHGRNGKIAFVEYDNGDGKTVKIPYEKCLHIVNNSTTNSDDNELWGVGDGITALNYYKLKRVVLTQLALATKNNSTGIVHAKVPNNGRTILVDSKMSPLKDGQGKNIEVTKQIALNYQLQDLYKKDYIVTDIDVEIDRIQIQNDERFWEYILNYIDRAIQVSFKVPVGIFDSGVGGIQNVGLSQNFKSIFDSTIYALTTLLKEELINKVIKRLLHYNFPFDWVKNNYGEFAFDVEEDQATINQRLSTIASLVASGILDQNELDVVAKIRKDLGLPALKESEKAQKEEDAMNAKIQKEVERQMTMMQMQMQMQQMQQVPPEPENGEAPQDYPQGA